MKKINGKTIIGALLGAILGVVILVLLSGYLRVRGILNKSNYVEDSKVQIRLEVLEELDKQERQRRREQIEQQEGLDEEERQRLLEELDNEEELFVLSPGMEDLVDNQDQEELQEEMLEGTYSILLVGSDRQDHSWYGNSDGMILVTINHNVQKIFLMSFMRDLYANIPGIGVRKMNAAYAVGGGPLLLQTLQQNYGVSVSDYASVDFAAMEDLIDLFGGVDIELNEAEAEYMNWPGITAGWNHLNGELALAYARIRQVGNSDWERTERQKRVLLEIYNRMNFNSVEDLQNLADVILPYVTHNLTESEILALLPVILQAKDYELVLDRVPFDGTYEFQSEIIVPDLAYTVQRIREEIYAKE